jgi:hypothetical protein
MRQNWAFDDKSTNYSEYTRVLGKRYSFVNGYNRFYPNRNEYQPILFGAMLHLCIVNSEQRIGRKTKSKTQNF